MSVEGTAAEPSGGESAREASAELGAVTGTSKSLAWYFFAMSQAASADASLTTSCSMLEERSSDPPENLFQECKQRNYCMVMSETYSRDGISPIGSCQPSDTHCSGSWLHTVNWIKSSNQKVPDTCVVLRHLRQSFAVALCPLRLPTSRQRPVWKVIRFTFRQHLRVLPELTCLRRATCLTYSPFSDEKFGYDYRNGSNGLYSSPAQNASMGHVVLDLTSLAYQPNSRERSPHLRRHVTIAHTPELDEDYNDKPLVRPDRASVSEDEDDNLLVQPSSRKEPLKEKREPAAERSIPTPL